MGFEAIHFRTAHRAACPPFLEAETGNADNALMAVRRGNGELQANRRYSVSRLLERIYRLKPIDRQIMLLYLEGEQSASIAEVTGLSAVNVATKIHRIKKLLNRQPGEGTIHVER